MAQTMKPQNSSGVPPLTRTKPRYLFRCQLRLSLIRQRKTATYVKMPSQLATQVEANPSMVMKLKFRCSTVSIIVDAVMLLIAMTYSQHLLLAHDSHIPSIGLCSPVLLRNMADIVIEDLCAIGGRSAGLGELDICNILFLLAEVKGSHGD